MRSRGGQAGPQDEAIYATRKAGGVLIESAKSREIAVAGKVPVAAEGSCAIVVCGEDDDVCFVVTCPRQEITFPLTRIIGGTEVCVAIAPFDFEATKFVFKHHIEDTRDRIGPVDSGGAIFE